MKTAHFRLRIPRLTKANILSIVAAIICGALGVIGLIQLLLGNIPFGAIPISSALIIGGWYINQFFSLENAKKKMRQEIMLKAYVELQPKVRAVRNSLDIFSRKLERLHGALHAEKPDYMYLASYISDIKKRLDTMIPGAELEDAAEKIDEYTRLAVKDNIPTDRLEQDKITEIAAIASDAVYVLTDLRKKEFIELNNALISYLIFYLKLEGAAIQQKETFIEFGGTLANILLKIRNPEYIKANRASLANEQNTMVTLLSGLHSQALYFELSLQNILLGEVAEAHFPLGKIGQSRLEGIFGYADPFDL